jgi:hypothetical protein
VYPIRMANVCPLSSTPTTTWGWSTGR